MGSPALGAWRALVSGRYPRRSASGEGGGRSVHRGREGQVRGATRACKCDFLQLHVQLALSNLDHGQLRVQLALSNLDHGQLRVQLVLSNLDQGQLHVRAALSNLDHGRLHVRAALSKVACAWGAAVYDLPVFTMRSRIMSWRSR